MSHLVATFHTFVKTFASSCLLSKTSPATSETIAPSAYQESYDNARLIVGDPHTEVTGVLISLDAIESVVDEAIAKKCNMIVSHHPIVFRGLKSLTGKNYVRAYRH